MIMRFPGRMWSPCLVAVLMVAGAGGHAAARVPEVQGIGSDSAAVAGAARRAQARFETVRRAGFPIEEGRGAPACETVTGRFCYWHDDGARPPDRRERPQVAEARRRLVAVLDSLAVLSPQDGWIAGQRVRYRLDGGDTTGAVRIAARECAPRGWWCAALAGYALHVAGDDEAAAAAYDSALATMDSVRRCEWETPAVALPPDDRRRLLAIPCSARAAAVARIWWLATPLLSRRANDFRVEYHARQVAALLESDARHLYDTSWGWDTRELLLRYGWPVWWTRERRPAAGPGASPTLVGHEASPSFSFMPSSRIAFDTRTIARDDDWSLRQERPHSRYAPGYARSWSSADAQVARFLRGDALLVVAAFAAPRDTMLNGPCARLVVSPAAGHAGFVSPPVTSTAGVLQVTLPHASLPAPGLASVELVDTATRAVARHRTGLAPLPHTGLRMSDLLLHAALDVPTRAAGLDAVAPHALHGTTVRDRRVAIYWETYGLAPGGEVIDVGITVEPVGVTWARRAAARIGIAHRPAPVAIRWQEAPDPAGGAAVRSVVVDLGALARGAYRVTVTVRRGNGTRASSERVITVARR